jgi:hypothetical protein
MKHPPRAREENEHCACPWFASFSFLVPGVGGALSPPHLLEKQLMGYGTFNLFGEDPTRDLFEARLSLIKSTVESESDDYILNVNEAEYVKFVVSKFTVEPVQLDFDGIQVSTYEKQIPAERHPSNYDVERGVSYKRDVIRYHIPISGPMEQLHWRPSQRYVALWPVSLEGNTLCYDVLDFGYSPDRLRQECDATLKEIRQQHAWLLSDIAIYNRSLEAQVSELLHERKEHLKKKVTLLAGLGVPVRRRADVPSTFAVPTPAKRQPIQVSRPQVAAHVGPPEPTLDEKTYTEILKTIQDVGKQFERMPSTYAGKEEEHLRDHFLLILEPNFEGSATGETFNKSGKTDILLRYEGKNVFVAECKFWRGEKGYLDTLTQLLGYLTWRDSKTAAIVFVRNRDFSPVLKNVMAVTSQHTNFVRFVSGTDETCLHYIFHLPGDKEREVCVAVMLFHIPGAQ